MFFVTTYIYSQIIPKSTYNYCKTIPKPTYNYSKIIPKATYNYFKISQEHAKIIRKLFDIILASFYNDLKMISVSLF